MLKFVLNKNKKEKAVLFCLIILFFFLSLPQNGANLAEQTSNALVEVNFSKATPVNSMSGFLHSIGADKPADKMISPLKPKQWRTGETNPAIYERLKKSGARIQIVLSDFWGYPGLNTNRKWAYQTGREFEDFVRQTARAHNSKQIIWDVWNEPDDLRLPFWKGTFSQFCETYLRAYRVLREELGPDAVIGGPSFSRYNKSRIKEFLDFCAANGCEVNFLSWHELDDRKITGIADRLNEARALFIDNPAYKKLKIKEIQINEIVGSPAQNKPGAILGYFYYLEKGRADGASKACWENSGGDYNCYNNTLDGLLKAENLLPTASWWIYKVYADGVESRVESSTTNPHLVALGSAQSGSPHKAQVLIGYFRESSSQPIRANVSLKLINLNNLPFISNLKEVRIRIEKIPNIGEREIQNLEFLSEGNFPLRNNSVQIPIENVSVGEAYLVTVSEK
jgi:hypothetical protein